MRFIPVHTGNTTDPLCRTIRSSVYPCAYREHNTDEILSVFVNGLSLCIQGTLRSHSGNQLLNRFIPVHTGNTNRRPQEDVRKPVYPCAYREHKNIYVRSIQKYGLSLCIQGTPNYMKKRFD